MTPRPTPAAADFVARRDREQRRHYARKPKTIADVLAQLITARGYGRIQADADFTAAWQPPPATPSPNTRSPAASAAACSKSPSATRRSIQELTFQKQQILTKLQTELSRRENPRPQIPRRQHHNNEQAH